MKKHENRFFASALLLVLWAVFVLTGAVLLWVGFVRKTVVIAGEKLSETEAKAMAHSGVALALHPLVKKETPVLALKSESDPGFRVSLISEGAKVNVNFLLIGEDPRKMEVFKRWLEYRGLEFEERERFVDCILDWIDPDTLVRINGQEHLEGYQPSNSGQLLSIDEIEQIAGSEPLTSQPGWREDLTLFSQGQIDLSSAEMHILRLLPGMNDPGIERFLQWRRGADEVDGTLDDPPFQKLEDAVPFLGLNKQAYSGLSGLIGLHDQTWQIKAEGWSGKVVRQVNIVARKGGNSQILDWKE